MVRKTRNFADDDVNELSALSNSGSNDRNEATRDAMSSIVCEFRNAVGLLSECSGSGDVILCTAPHPLPIYNMPSMFCFV
jgi:hypothetical protein